ncbi:MAG: acyl-CoA thioesterase [Acidimicrobiia bacterium]
MFEHRIRVRYGECDMQGVVFNANYLVYIDDTTDTWTRSLTGGGPEGYGYDFMLKKAELTWHSPVRFGESIDIKAHVGRWGRTSFDAVITGSVDGRAAFDATITYVIVALGTNVPTPPSDELRTALGG